MTDNGNGVRLLLTGGIGSGKSTAARILAELGATVIYADQIGHEVLAGPGLEAVARRWPTAVKEGRIDRARLASIVFHDETQLGELEAITHPLIRKEISREVSRVPADRVVVVEISVPAAMVEGEWTTVVIDVPDRLRRERLLRRGMAPADIDARMERQPSRREWRALGDVVIDNSHTEDVLRRQLNELMASLAQ